MEGHFYSRWGIFNKCAEGVNSKRTASLELGAHSCINDIFFSSRRAKVFIWLATEKDADIQVNPFSGSSIYIV